MEKQTSYGPFSKDWSELTFSDNYIFTQVLQNETLCKEVLKIISGLSITKIEYIPSDEEKKDDDKSSSSDKDSDNTTVTTEKMIDPNYLSKGIRLDVLVEDSDKLYDIEMQTGNYSDLFLRLRYYQSQIDNYSLNKGDSYRALKESYIFFICKDDPFGADFPKYTQFIDFKEYYDPKYVDTKNLKGKYNDKSHVIIYNASGYDKVQKDLPLRDFLEYVSKGTYSGNSNFLDELDSAVKKTKQDAMSKGKYMTFQDAINNAVSDNTAILEEKYKKELEASEEKRKQDLQASEEKYKKELEKQKMESAKIMLESGISFEKVINKLKLSKEEIEVLKKENK